MSGFDVKEYFVPSKKEIPCLHYDIALYCKTLKQTIPFQFPDYLEDFTQKVNSYAKQTKECKPKEFPSAWRTYIIDYRLNILFAALDVTGNIATCFSNYGKYGANTEDYYYGDGSHVGHVFVEQSKKGNAFVYDSDEMVSFLNANGFLPLEELSNASALVFGGSKLVEKRLISQYQTALLMEKFRNENLIDWETLVTSTRKYCRV